MFTSDIHVTPIASKKTNPWDWTHLELIALPKARLEIAARVDTPRPEAPPCLGWVSPTTLVHPGRLTAGN